MLLVLALVDCEKALDSVEIKSVYETLRQKGINSVYTNTQLP